MSLLLDAHTTVAAGPATPTEGGQATIDASGLTADTVAIEVQASAGWLPLRDAVQIMQPGVYLLSVPPGRVIRANHSVASGDAVTVELR